MELARISNLLTLPEPAPPVIVRREDDDPGCPLILEGFRGPISNRRFILAANIANTPMKETEI